MIMKGLSRFGAAISSGNTAGRLFHLGGGVGGPGGGVEKSAKKIARLEREKNNLYAEELCRECMGKKNKLPKNDQESKICAEIIHNQQ